MTPVADGPVDTLYQCPQLCAMNAIYYKCYVLCLQLYTLCYQCQVEVSAMPCAAYIEPLLSLSPSNLYRNIFPSPHSPTLQPPPLIFTPYFFSLPPPIVSRGVLLSPSAPFTTGSCCAEYPAVLIEQDALVCWSAKYSVAHLSIANVTNCYTFI